MSWPAYLDTHASGELAGRATQAVAALASCRVCPRDCQIDRLSNDTAVCKVGRKARVSTWFAHFGEEDCLRGWNGSGTIFFSWCNLKCVFCQNWETSNEGHGDEVDAAGLAEIMLDLQRQGCHNINFVTPEHVVPQVLEALPIAIERGLRLPIVYNTSAYDSLDSLRLMDGIVDIYMPDFKYWTEAASLRYLRAKDYPDRARAAILEMHRQVGDLELGPDRLARRGLLVRHLVMPGAIGETAAILDWLATSVGVRTYVNVMDQYHVDGLAARKPDKYPELQRGITNAELTQAYELAHAAGLERLDARDPHPRLRQRFRFLPVV